jgi:hypothetical protein
MSKLKYAGPEIFEVSCSYKTMISMHVSPCTLVEGRQLSAETFSLYLWTNHRENAFSPDKNIRVVNINIF